MRRFKLQVKYLDDPEPADCGPYAKEHLEKVIWNGHEIFVPPLYLLANVNKRRGRNERAEIIEAYMNKVNK